MKKDVKAILSLLIFTIGVLSIGNIKSKIDQKKNQFSGIVNSQTVVAVPLK